jgi:peptidoglycan/xylan/chitin deacetylase (PgdA/CDA1 family)
MYHAVGDRAASRFSRFVVSAPLLHEHLCVLRGAGYETVTITQLVELLSTGHGPGRRLACVTFDDAFADFARLALPVLREAAVSATLYVPTAFVGRTAAWLASVGEGDRPLLTWQELFEVAGEGVECGAHSHRHLELDTLPLELLAREVDASKQLLEDRLGRRVTSFCYPFGYHSPAVREAVRAAGFSSASAVGYRLHPLQGDRFAIQRVLVTGDTTPEKLLAMLEGRHRSPMPVLRRLAQPSWQRFRRARSMLRSLRAEERRSRLRLE